MGLYCCGLFVNDSSLSRRDSLLFQCRNTISLLSTCIAVLRVPSGGFPCVWSSINKQSSLVLMLQRSADRFCELQIRRGDTSGTPVHKTLTLSRITLSFCHVSGRQSPSDSGFG